MGGSVPIHLLCLSQQLPSLPAALEPRVCHCLTPPRGHNAGLVSVCCRTRAPAWNHSSPSAHWTRAPPAFTPAPLHQRPQEAPTSLRTRPCLNPTVSALLWMLHGMGDLTEPHEESQTYLESEQSMPGKQKFFHSLHLWFPFPRLPPPTKHPPLHSSLSIAPPKTQNG